jgi:hypothetical protein
VQIFEFVKESLVPVLRERVVEQRRRRRRMGI